MWFVISSLSKLTFVREMLVVTLLSVRCEMWRRVKSSYNPRTPPSPTHPAPWEKADRLAQFFAARTSPLLLPNIRRKQTDLEDARAAIIATACAEEADTDAPFSSGKLDAAVCYRPDT